MKTAFALALAAAAVAPAICCESTLFMGQEMRVTGYDCTAGA